MPPDDDSSQRIAALERKVAELQQALQRASVQQALMDERLLILEQNRLFRWWNKFYRAAVNLYAYLGSDDRYGGLADLRPPGDYQRWVNHEEELLEREDHGVSGGPVISVYVTAGEGAARSLQSVFDQCYSNWELCLPGSLQPDVRADSRIRIVADRSEATGEYVLTLHAGDRLSPHALYFYAQAHCQHPSAIFYSDEDSIAANGVRSDPVFKPGWSPELLRSTMYLGRAVLYPRTAGFSVSPSSCVHHIPKVLYHRAASTPRESTPPTYTAPPNARLSVMICSREMRRLQECMKAVRDTAAIPIELLVVHHLDSGSGDEMRRSIEEFGATWIPYRGPFDFARMNNLAAAKATAPYLVFLNDDVIVQQRGWDAGLSAALAQPGIGIAGAILQYPSGTIQHAGVVVGMGDGAGHCGRFQMNSQLWPWLRMSRDVTAVTGAMLAIRSELFQQMQGFDEIFPVNYNDVDLCLRVRKAGLRVVCLDLGKVIHRENQTRIGGTRYEEREEFYKRWAEVLAQPDEFYSPNLAPSERIALGTRSFSLSQLIATR